MSINRVHHEAARHGVPVTLAITAADSRHDPRDSVTVNDFSPFAYALYALPFLAIVAIYVARRRRAESRSRRELAAARESGLAEPMSLHPVVDPVVCIGSGSCAKACPEQALGIINGKAQLTNPAACIGHGACEAACPVERDQTGVRTERRGVDIPLVKPNFETNVPGIFIAGELGGMGLIRKASEQGRQAIEALRKRRARRRATRRGHRRRRSRRPAAGLGAMEHGLRYRLIEQEDSIGGTVYHYPRNKIAMTAPVDLARGRQVSVRRSLQGGTLSFWQEMVGGARGPLRGAHGTGGRGRRDFRRADHRGDVHTARSLLLAIGRRGSPRKLEVPGEELPKVVYRLVEAEQYRGQRVLVVGGGDSALEAAVACADAPGTRVTLSYRGDAFGRVKAKNRDRIDSARAARRIDVLLNTMVKRILPTSVELIEGGAERAVENDAVVVQAGGELPTALLRQLGVTVETKYGTA